MVSKCAMLSTIPAADTASKNSGEAARAAVYERILKVYLNECGKRAWQCMFDKVGIRVVFEEERPSGEREKRSDAVLCESGGTDRRQRERPARTGPA